MALLGETSVAHSGQSAKAATASPPLFTTITHCAMSPTHGFFDCAAFRLDEVIRRTMGHIAGYLVLDAKEGTEGGRSNIRNPRKGLYNKIFSADAISHRLPYATNSAAVALRGILRSAVNHALAPTT